MSAIKERLRANEDIRVESVRLIADGGEQVGIVPTTEALSMAKEASLDLVEVSPNAEPPVCKIMDFGKFQYQKNKREHESKKKSHKTDVKELRFRPGTGENDIDRKIAKAREFLESGHRVQLTMLFRGRERAHTDIGRDKLVGLAKLMEDLAKIERMPGRIQGNRFNIQLTPKKDEPTQGGRKNA